MIPRALALGCLTTMAAAAGTAFAQPSALDIAQAREFYNEGLELRASGDLPGSLEKLKAAHRLGRTPITGLELGRAYVALGRFVEAREVLLGVARIPPSPDETNRSMLARKESERLAEQLRTKIAKLTVRLPDVDVNGYHLTIDGADAPAEALTERPVDPGSHVVTSVAPSGSRAEITIQLNPGEAREVDVPVQTFGPPRSRARQSSGLDAVTPARAERSYALEAALFGGGAALALGGGALMIAGSRASSVASHAHDRAAYDRAADTWTAGLVMAVAGAATAATGTIVLTTRSTPQHVALWMSAAPCAVRVGGAF